METGAGPADCARNIFDTRSVVKTRPPVRGEQSMIEPNVASALWEYSAQR
jgi:hypothetical protein